MHILWYHSRKLNLPLHIQYPPKFSLDPASLFTPKKGTHWDHSTLSLTKTPYFATLLTPKSTPQNFLWPPRPYLPLRGAITPSNDPPNDLVTIIMRLAGYARLAHACVSGEIGGRVGVFGCTLSFRWLKFRGKNCIVTSAQY